MALSHDQALNKFKNYLQRPDFPLRLISRVVIVRGMTTYLLANREILEQDNVFAAHREDINVLDLTESMWRKTWASWQRLLSEDLSDRVISAWTRQTVGA